MQKKRSRRRKKLKWLLGAWQPADSFFFFSNIFRKIAFHLLITAGKVPPKVTGLILQGLWGSKTCTTVSSPMNFQSEGAVRSATRPFILSAARQQANLCLGLFFFFSPYLSKGLSCIHFNQAKLCATWKRHVQVSRTCLRGNGGQADFFWTDVPQTHQQPSATRMLPFITEIVGNFALRAPTQAAINTDFVNGISR